MNTAANLYSSIDTIWVLLGTVLVFFMQAGFSMVETGFTRAKNAGNIIMKNLMDFSIGSIVFLVLGFGLMFGASYHGIIGIPDFFVRGNYSSTIPTYAFLIFQTVFCATASTIVSGAMAERTKFISYIIYSGVISAIIYPISGHWIWGGGWLSQLGFHDFAGSTAVHMVGGLSALRGATILGPRIGKYAKDGKSNAIPGHNLTIGALGVFILWFSWFGFNGGSTFSATGEDTLLTVTSIFVTTNIAAAVSATATMIVTWCRYKKPDVSMTLNGALAGLVGITAGADLISPIGAAAIGLFAGVIVVFGIEFIDKILKVDDPVGSIAVHGLCGAVGTILVGVFALNDGLLYGGGFGMLKVQTLGVFAVAAWVLLAMTIIFNLIKKTVGLRVSPEEEFIGLDITEHGLVSSYADFMPMSVSDSVLPSSIVNLPTKPVPDISVEKKTAIDSPSKVKMTKIALIIKQEKFEALKAAMTAIGITGMTVTQVLGFGMQKGAKYYRGVKVGAGLLPKVKVDIVISKIPVSIAIETAKKVLQTGYIGDGKIFVYDVENVIKVRTGEEGYDALQDEE
ncbi:MAG: ammonium transporter [Desulfitobacteriaceae bacterium]|nr:ammonium transporter [Desulfitobacteriaceae bacterium]MDD4565574.1 ammonium transporter [Eubacteriales bacterium]